MKTKLYSILFFAIVIISCQKKSVVFLLLMFFGFITISNANPLPADRWMEIDLYWFNRDNMEGSVNEFWDRYYPLVEDIEGWKGVILNVGWLMDYVVEWEGNPDQKIALPKNMKQWEVFKEQGALTGTTEERIALWRQRFTKERVFTTINYQPWSYRDLKKLAATLRKVASQKYHLEDIKVGTLVIGWERIYNGDMSNFAKTHSNVYLNGVYSEKVVNLEAILKADSRKYATYPKGIPEGTPFTEFFGKQWGGLSKEVGLDAILFRDSFFGSGVYGRTGLYGKIAPPDPSKIERWTKAASDLLKQTKTANPECITIGYSNGASGIADWRVNCLDLEAIAKEGYLDAWIDQTWAGAWNEIGQRPYWFWNSQDLGWTYQLAYLLARAAALADTKVHHYFLTETFDAWESWDIIHNAPERLRWGIWAYSHAAVKTPSGLKVPKGTYVSWGNQGKELLTKDDVKFLSSNLKEAINDANRLKKVFGPTIVYNRRAIEWQSKNAPDLTIKEWIDEQAGSLMKWSVPLMSITRIEYLPEVESDMFIFQTPVHLANKDKETIINLIRSGKPLAVVGTPAGGIEPEIAKLVGISTSDSTIKDIKYIGSLNYMSESEGIHENLESSFPVYQPFTNNTSEKDLNVIYSVAQSPCLGINKSENKQVIFWDPPELKVNATNSFTELGTSTGELLGSPEPWVLMARVVNSIAKSAGQTYIEKIEKENPVFVSFWEKDDGTYRILTGNLEEGIIHSANQSKQLVINYPAGWSVARMFEVDELWKGSKQVSGNRKIYVFLDQAETKLYSIRKSK